MLIRDLAIIGGGPAGLAAGIYAARAALKTVLFERGMPGGLAASTEIIENYPGFSSGIGGPELAQNMEAQARRFGLELVYAGVEEITRKDGYFYLKTEDGEFKTGAVIAATGAKPRFLEIKGEKEFHGRGVSYCATCDGAFFRGKRVAVVGGGDAAVEEAIFLTKFAEKVTIVHRRGDLRAARYLQQKARQNDKIEFVLHSVPVEIKGEEAVEGISLKDIRTDRVTDLAVDGVFIYVGHSPSTELVRGLADLDEKGYIITDEEMRTRTAGLFAAGDVRKKLLRQVVTAVADGAIAAASAEKYLESL
ncbi:MAG: thioredoxin-disulfide reductase [Peptococcaceae bacterium]|nr:thioredoxin-disulfide reductase [Peptococcaceae bacterium]